jgi:hypothetical protein
MLVAQLDAGTESLARQLLMGPPPTAHGDRVVPLLQLFRLLAVGGCPKEAMPLAVTSGTFLTEAVCALLNIMLIGLGCKVPEGYSGVVYLNYMTPDRACQESYPSFERPSPSLTTTIIHVAARDDVIFRHDCSIGAQHLGAKAMQGHQTACAGLLRGMSGE